MVHNSTDTDRPDFRFPTKPGLVPSPGAPNPRFRADHNEVRGPGEPIQTKASASCMKENTE